MKPVSNQSSGGFGIHDALYIVFKHKWKIIVLSLLGFLAAGAMYYQVTLNPSYESTAKLMVRYVVNRATVDREESEGMNSGGMMTEMEILKSGDTAVEIAAKVGPAKLMPQADPEPTPVQAASKILGGLKVESPKVSRHQSSNFLYISYRNEDPVLAVEVLDQVIKTYFERHLSLHRSTEAFEQVQKQTDQARSALRQTEETINRLKEQSGVLMIEATMAEFEERRRGILESRLQVESQLAEQQAKVRALEAFYKESKSSEAGSMESERLSPGQLGLTVEERDIQRQRLQAINEYRNFGERLNMLQQRRNELLIQKKPGHPMIEALDQQIAEVKDRSFAMVEEYPELGGVAAGGRQAPVSSLEDEKALASALEAKLQAVEAQVKGLESEVSQISALGFQLAELERQREMEEEKYRYFQSSLEKARIDETLDPAKIPNISIVQSPSPPVESIDEESMKLIMGLAASGLIAGLGLAFVLEMVVDRRVSRSTEIETRLQIPLMLSIPYIRSRDSVAKLIGREPGLELLGDAGDVILPPVPASERIYGGDKSLDPSRAAEHFITPYAAAIRDRIMFNFEVNNITHKPKLVAVTGLSDGSGVSTVAAGLANSLAEAGDRKVLLVDLNPILGADVPHGNPANSLMKALQISREETFHRSPRTLYFASAPLRREGRRSTSLAPTKLHELIPSLTASEFDYIIFDMPPVDPTSPTLTMAGFMDKVLLVLDAEKTTRESLRWGYSELEKGRADVSCVYNKARSHAPRWVQGSV